jgi:hypothetical protein
MSNHFHLVVYYDPQACISHQLAASNSFSGGFSRISILAYSDEKTVCLSYSVSTFLRYLQEHTRQRFRQKNTKASGSECNATNLRMKPNLAQSTLWTVFGRLNLDINRWDADMATQLNPPEPELLAASWCERGLRKGIQASSCAARRRRASGGRF